MHFHDCSWRNVLYVTLYNISAEWPFLTVFVGYLSCLWVEMAEGQSWTLQSLDMAADETVWAGLSDSAAWETQAADSFL